MGLEAGRRNGGDPCSAICSEGGGIHIPVVFPAGGEGEAVPRARFSEGRNGSPCEGIRHERLSDRRPAFEEDGEVPGTLELGMMDIAFGLA